ncbi:MAG: OmpA family protein [Paracoccaceae bacterium]|nr:OmpA family protein [Paracoccaceae bacterium]
MRPAFGSVALGVVLLTLPLSALSQEVIKRDRYKPALAQTPDGCQVWMIDDGWEGYAWNRTTPDGKPVCLEVESCLVANSDQLFATDSATIRPAEKARLQKFFRQQGVFSYGVHGHTDSRASDEYNINLSKRRANAVAAVAQSVGARLASVKGFGERLPVASNATAAGMQKNRRVEIMCYREIGRY